MSACQWPDQETNFDLSVESHFINEPSDNSGLRENIHVIRVVQVHSSYRGNNEAPSWYDDAWSEMICGSDDDIASWHWSWSWYVRNHQQLYNTHIWSMVSTDTNTGLAAFKFNIKYKSVGFQCLVLSAILCTSSACTELSDYINKTYSVTNIFEKSNIFHCPPPPIRWWCWVITGPATTNSHYSCNIELQIIC